MIMRLNKRRILICIINERRPIWLNSMKIIGKSVPAFQ